MNATTNPPTTETKAISTNASIHCAVQSSAFGDLAVHHRHVDLWHYLQQRLALAEVYGSQ